MPEIPHTMTYALLPGATDGVSVYQCQCCRLWFYHAPQAMFHLWRWHGLTAEEAWAQVDIVRSASVPAQPPGSNTAPPTPGPGAATAIPSNANTIGFVQASFLDGDIATEKQALIDECLARFRASLAQP